MINGHINNYAKRRGFEFDVYEVDDEMHVHLFEVGEEYDPMVAFVQRRLDGLHLKGFAYNKHLAEGTPELITSVDELKRY